MKLYKKMILLYAVSLALLALTLSYLAGLNPMGPAGPLSAIVPEALVGYLDSLSEGQRRAFYLRSEESSGLIWSEQTRPKEQRPPFPNRSTSREHPFPGGPATGEHPFPDGPASGEHPFPHSPPPGHDPSATDGDSRRPPAPRGPLWLQEGPLVLHSQKFPDRIYRVRTPSPFPVPLHPGIVTLIFMLLMMLGSGLLIVYTLKPLSDLAGSMLRFGEGNTSLRFSRRPRSAETRLLSGAFNSMADQIEEARYRDGLLLRAITHELRNPLMALRWGFEVFRRKNADSNTDSLQKAIQSLERSMNEVHVVTRGILESRTGTVELEWVEPLEFLDSFRKEMLPLFGNEDRSLEIQANQRPSPVLANRDHLSVILKNLARNFMQYEPPGRPMIIEVRSDARSLAIRISTTISENATNTDHGHSPSGARLDSRASTAEAISKLDNGSYERAEATKRPQVRSAQDVPGKDEADEAGEVTEEGSRSGEGIGLSIAQALARAMGWKLKREDGIMILSTDYSEEPSGQS